VDAESRAAFILKNTLDYSCHLTLHKGQDYEGLININFQTSNTAFKEKEVKIDFQGKKVVKMMINEHVVADPHGYHHTGGLWIPQNWLRSNGRNNVLVQYLNEYDKDGNGCVSFIDVDGKQYLYTQF
jgi:hypothetical protein